MAKLRKMDDQNVSAFAAYTAKAKKKKADGVLSLKLKPKRKLKKKKFQENNVNSLMNAFLKVNASENPSVKDKSKHTERKELIRSLLKAKKESIFTDCNFGTKVNNIFFEDEYQAKDSDKESNLKQIGERNTNNLEDQELRKGEKNNGKDLHNSNEVKLKKNCQIIEKNCKGDCKYIIAEMVKVKKKKKIEEKNVVQTFKNPKLIYSDSVKVGEEVFSWMLSPLDVKDFFETCWEQKPLHVRRNDVNFFSTICTLKDFESALEQNDMYFTKNIDVTSYINGERTTDNPEGKARPSIVWDMYKNGKSIRLLNPQTFIPNVQLLSTTLQEFFQCFVGANIYLTPPGTQGFAPHYDDIEAFVLQLEGEKHWKLYNPRTLNEVLPRESSQNFYENEIGDPIMEITLQPGDLLYFPRGIIHQAKCLPHIHSLHITVSCYQKNSWADLLEKVLPVGLQKAVSEDVEFRKGLPIGYLNHMGMVFCDRQTKLRREIFKKFEELALKVMRYCPLDAAADQMGANFMHDALPPCLNNEEKLYGSDPYDQVADENILDRFKNFSDKDLGLKLVRANSVRLVSEENGTFLYYTTDNSLVYHEHEACSISVPISWAQAIEHLILSYPNFVKIKDLPVFNKVNKPSKWKRIAELVYFLWQKGLLLFDRALQEISSS